MTIPDSMRWPPELEAKVARFPRAPGCYLMRGSDGSVLYVGKARRLRERVRAYLRGTDERAFVPILPRIVRDIEVLEVGSEKEALLLENELIKKHRPPFNVLLKDDKSFITLRLDRKHAHPRLEVWRRPDDDGARYFGPYASAAAVRETLRLINRYFQLRTCSDSVLSNRKRPCLQFQIGRCPAPCVLEVPTYDRNVEDTALFLSGKHDRLLVSLRKRMKSASDRMAYEEAARLRDQIRAVERTLEQQRVVQVQDRRDRDVFGIYREGPALEVQLLTVRRGRLVGGRSFSFSGQAFPSPELLASLLSQYYGEGAEVPAEVLVPLRLPEREALESLLSERRGGRVHLLQPQKGEKRRLLELAEQNAHTGFVTRRKQEEEAGALLESLQRNLRLKNYPARIEGFDISQVQGSSPVASRVAVTEGKPDSSRYRRYRIKEVEGQDDFAMMREVLTRRLLRGVEEGDLPDLLVVDGGKGQLGVAHAVMKDLGIDGIDLIGLAKSRREAGDEGARSLERVFVYGRKDPIVLRQDSAELFVLTRLRDEAHRFAITYHRQRRRQKTLSSPLDRIPGVGPARRKALLKHFGSLREVKAASVEALAAAPGISATLAALIHEGLRGD
ncbi:MAG: excinuclease ABC subunit UvrC [Deltaproteobacteria bacterium]|nr:excinuclease ABC subunit UvrC [Deltaproteobacteria bacterium]